MPRVQFRIPVRSLSRVGAGTSSLIHTSNADGNASSRSARERHGRPGSGPKRNGRPSCDASTSGKNVGKTKTVSHSCGTWISLADYPPAPPAAMSHMLPTCFLYLNFHAHRRFIYVSIIICRPSYRYHLRLEVNRYAAFEYLAELSAVERMHKG